MAKLKMKDLAANVRANQKENAGQNEENNVKTDNESVINQEVTDQSLDSGENLKVGVTVDDKPERPNALVANEALKINEANSKASIKPKFTNNENIDLVKVEVPEKNIERKNGLLFDMADVVNWKRPETVGKKKLVELNKEYDIFFAKVKATTGITTVKFVNYIVRDFLINNPDFVKFINEESGKSPQLE